MVRCRWNENFCWGESSHTYVMRWDITHCVCWVRRYIRYLCDEVRRYTCVVRWNITHLSGKVRHYILLWWGEKLHICLVRMYVHYKPACWDNTLYISVVRKYITELYVEVRHTIQCGEVRCYKPVCRHICEMVQICLLRGYPRKHPVEDVKVEFSFSTTYNPRLLQQKLSQVGWKWEKHRKKLTLLQSRFIIW